jgi:hypothetical protein
MPPVNRRSDHGKVRLVFTDGFIDFVNRFQISDDKRVGRHRFLHRPECRIRNAHAEPRHAEFVGYEHKRPERFLAFFRKADASDDKGQNGRKNKLADSLQGRNFRFHTDDFGWVFIVIHFSSFSPY